MSASAPTRAPSSSKPAGQPATWLPLDGMRGLGALLVLTFHVYQNQIAVALPPGEREGPVYSVLYGLGASSVVLFFMMSGFLTYRSIATSALRGAPVGSSLAFMLRRISRLYPLYFVVIVVVWAFTNPSVPGHWQDLLLHLSFTHVYNDRFIFWTVGPAWALAAEFHFYLVMALTAPLLARAALRLQGQSVRVALVMVPPLLMLLAAAGWYYWHLVVVETPYDDWSTWFSPLTAAGHFAVGMVMGVLAAVGVRVRAERARKALMAVALLGIVGLIVGMQREVVTSERYLSMYAYLPFVACLLIAVVLAPPEESQLLRLRGMTFLGSLGYGIFLLHEPVMRLARWLGLLPERDGQSWDIVPAWLVVAPLSITLAWLSSKLVEPNGTRFFTQFTDRGRLKEYYPHLVVTPKRVGQRAPLPWQRGDEGSLSLGRPLGSPGKHL